MYKTDIIELAGWWHIFISPNQILFIHRTCPQAWYAEFLLKIQNQFLLEKVGARLNLKIILKYLHFGWPATADHPTKNYPNHIFSHKFISSTAQLTKTPNPLLLTQPLQAHHLLHPSPNFNFTPDQPCSKPNRTDPIYAKKNSRGFQKGATCCWTRKK